MFGLVVAPLRGGIDGAVWDLATGDAEWLHHSTLRLLHALGWLGVDGDVAGLVAGELNLAALLVALGDLFSISFSKKHHRRDKDLVSNQYQVARMCSTSDTHI